MNIFFIIFVSLREENEHLRAEVSEMRSRLQNGKVKVEV